MFSQTHELEQIAPNKAIARTIALSKSTRFYFEKPIVVEKRSLQMEVGT